MKELILCFVFTIGLLGCSPKNLSSEIVTEQTSTQDNLIQSTPLPSIVPTPIASKGTVVGTLISTISDKPLTGLTLYFGTLLPLTPGPDYLISMDLANSPKTIIREGGRFIAENISPGNYVLLIWTPHESRYILDPNKPDKELIVEVIAGQIVDLGEVYASPPP